MSQQRSWSVTQLLFRQSLPLESETAIFILVSALDVWMTALLLLHPEGLFIEANPVARYFIYGYGLKGMVAFKFALVALVAVNCQIIAWRRLELARKILQFGVVVVSAVVLYSFLLFRHAA